MLSYVGQDAVLGVPNARGIIEATPLFKQLRRSDTATARCCEAMSHLALEAIARREKPIVNQPI
jgi:hypothetical protein